MTKPLSTLAVAALAIVASLGASRDLRVALAPVPRATTAVTSSGALGVERRRRVTASARLEARRRIAAAKEGTYIGDILLDHDSALARWPERVARPLTVWIQPSSTVKDWQPVFVERARRAFEDWQATGIPLRFAFVRDSAAAEVHLVWTDRFAEPISGKTLWARDDDWWIVDGDITIAVHHHRGETLDPAAVRAITLHEVGHLIGLDHTPDATTIMTPKVRVRELSPADRATARLLYTLPAGAMR